MSRLFAGLHRMAGATALSLAVVALAGIMSLPAHAQLAVEGAISQVSPPAPETGAFGAVTITNSAGDTRLFLAADTQILVAGLAAALTDLNVGETAQAEYVAGTDATGATVLTATRIAVNRSEEELFGLVTQVGPNPLDSSVVNVTIDPPAGDPVTLQVNAETDLKVGGRAVELAALTAALRGWYAEATFLDGPEENNPASELQFRKARRLPFKGVVEEAEGNSLTLAVGEGEYLTLEVGSETRVRLNGRPPENLMKLTAGDLCHGLWAMVLDEDPAALEGHCVALQVIARWPRSVPYSGTIQLPPAPTVSVARRGRAGTIGETPIGQFTLTLRNGTTVTPVFVYNETSLRINGKPGKFGDLKEGQQVHILCIPRADGYHCFRLQAKKPPVTPSGDAAG